MASSNGLIMTDGGKLCFGLLVVGDEILSGKRPDRHFVKVAELMAARGLRLSWVSYLGDDRARLTDFLQRTLAGNEVVFSCGGIGNTPDDHTRQAAAAALGVDLVLHAEAEKEIRARFGVATTASQLIMGTFPAGSEIIPNPFNRIPGFSLAGTHFFVPGFPQMAWPMIEWVLETRFRAQFEQAPVVDKALLLTGTGAYESALLDLMERIVAAYPDLRLFSLPSVGEKERAADGGEAIVRRHLELGVEGAPERVAAAMEEIRQEVERRGIAWSWRP